TKTSKRGRVAVLATLASLMLALFLVAGCSSDKPETPGESESQANAEADANVENDAPAGTIDAAAFDALVANGPVADGTTIAASEWATSVMNEGVLRVGAVQTSTLFSLLNEVDGHTRGFDAGLFQLLANYILGDPNAYEITQVTSDTRESVLQNDQVDAVFATYTINAKRAELISFAGPYYASQQAILVKADNTDINGLEDLEGKIVAVQSGSNGPAIMDEYAPGATQ
ncbi:MAG: transporter substrate-binding domain-containing protein, partial [Eggerthellaceae bacterium]|nr:transporter substrate-binding domain-containing protein [Eggerthellaceae bacterium]